MKDLNELNDKKPDSFMFKGKLYKMIHYSREATHEPTKQISDLIIWENNTGETITYNKGLIKTEE